MKLTKEQIQYLDDYLKRNGVKFWDVRMELLDHFATGIEQKLTEKNCTFEEAFDAVNSSFGNKVRKKYVLNKENTEWILADTSSIGKVLKKLENEKRKQIGVTYRKAYGKQVYELFFSTRFYAEYLLMILAIFVTAKYSEKWALGVGFLFVFYPYFIIAYNYIKGKIPKKSLHIQISMMGLFLWINMLNLIPNGYKSIYDEKLEFSLFALLLILIFPFIKASFMRYNKVCKEFKKYHDLIV